jgi:tetratricopeptide (TPR) repeat protein
LLGRVEKALLGFLLLFGVFSGPLVSASVAQENSNDEVQALLAQRKWAEAAIVSRSAIRQNPKSVSANADLAKALLYLGRREEALGVLSHAIELNKGPKRDWLVEQSRVIAKIFVTNTTFQIYQDGVDLLTAEKTRNAREKFEQALIAEPANVEILVRLGQSYLLDGDHDSAAERLKLARRLDPYEPEVHLWLGRALQLRGEMADSLDELRSAANELKQSELAPVWLADALETSGNRFDAIRVLEDDLKANPIHVTALLHLAKYKVDDADADQARLWSARKDFQNALSRITDYSQPGRRSFESELGVELPHQEKSLHDQIQSNLQKLESRLEADSSR